MLRYFVSIRALSGISGIKACKLFDGYRYRKGKNRPLRIRKGFTQKGPNKIAFHWLHFIAKPIGCVVQFYVEISALQQEEFPS